MIKIGVLVDESPAKDYLNQIFGNNPFQISCLYHSAQDQNMFSEFFTEVPQTKSFETLLKNSDALLFLEGASPNPDNIVKALKNFKHIFLSLPPKISEKEFSDIVKLADEANVLVWTGNPLLFSPAFFSCKQEILNPVHIEIKRKGIPQFRLNKDITGKLISDIEFILAIINGHPRKVHATGVHVEGNQFNMINSHIEFDNGTSAGITYNMLHKENFHKARIYQHEKYISIDFPEGKSNVYKLQEPLNIENSLEEANISYNSSKRFIANHDSFQNEIMAFHNSLVGLSIPGVMFEESFLARTMAEEILGKILIPVNHNISRS